MAKMTPRTLSGFMELLPGPQQQMERIMEILRRTYSLYGFTPLDTPVIESSEVLLAKGGGETRDAAGAVVREMETETFVPEGKEHRMVQEFRDFARIIDTDDRAEAERLAEETLAVMQIVETAL